MLIVFYVLLVWLKIVVTSAVVFLWLWIARDRGAAGGVLVVHAVGALIVWAAPWAVFLWTQSDLYRGKCGSLRQGLHDCGMAEFLWDQLQWLRLGMLLDVLLLVGALIVIFRSRLSSGTNSGALGVRR